MSILVSTCYIYNDPLKKRNKIEATKSKHVKSSDKYFIFYHHKNILHKILILLTI